MGTLFGELTNQPFDGAIIRLQSDWNSLAGFVNKGATGTIKQSNGNFIVVFSKPHLIQNRKLTFDFILDDRIDYKIIGSVKSNLIQMKSNNDQQTLFN